MRNQFRALAGRPDEDFPMTSECDVCPVCGKDDSVSLYPQYNGRCITTQMLYCDGITLDNRCCQSCGFIWNAQGLRHGQDIMFDTDVQKPKPQILSFGVNISPLQKRTLERFQAMHKFSEKGSLLDFGAGNGSFLRYFHAQYPGWELSGLEPKDDFPELVADLPLRHAVNTPYYDSDLKDTFSMVIVMSVLEHVPDPLGALRWIYDRLEPGGMLLMRHPNFASLPGDLFCADHVNKMTIPHTRQLAEHVGFRVVAEDLPGMLFFFALQKVDAPVRGLPDCHEETLPLARYCEQVARETIDATERCVGAARGRGRKAAVFGTSPIGSMAHLLLECRDDVACFVDENKNTWGCEIDGIPVVGPEKMEEMDVSDLVLAISPLYWDQVGRKMSSFPVRVHVPHLKGDGE